MVEKKAIIALVAAWMMAGCAGSNKYKYYSYPTPEEYHFSEIVEVDASAEDLLRKFQLYFPYHGSKLKIKEDGTIVFWNTVTYHEVFINDGQYQMRYNLEDNVYAVFKSNKDPHKENSERLAEINAKVAKIKADRLAKATNIEAASLKQAMLAKYTDDEFEELMENGYKEYENGQYEKSVEYFRKASVAEPYDEGALILYGNSLLALAEQQQSQRNYPVSEGFDRAIYVYGLMPESNVAQNNIQVAKNVKQAANSAAEERRMEEYRRRQQRQAEYEQERQRQNELALEGFINALSNLSAMTNQNYQAGQVNQAYSAGGGTGANCGSYQSRYSKMKSSRDDEADANNLRKASARGKNAANANSPDKADAATSGDHRLINSSNRNIRKYEREMDKIEREARQAGCSVH